MKVKHTNRVTLTVDLNDEGDVEEAMKWLRNNSGFRVIEMILFERFEELRDDSSISKLDLVKEYKDIRNQMVKDGNVLWAEECGLREAKVTVYDAEKYEDLKLTQYYLSTLLANYSDV